MSRWLPPAASAHAADIDLVTTLVHLLVLALFVGWGVYFVWVLIRFRRARQPRANPAGAVGRWAIAVQGGIVVAEVVLLVGFDLPIWHARAALSDAPSATIVRVVAEQFLWNVHYPGPDRRFGQVSVSLITPDNPLGLDRHSAGGADDIVVENQLHAPVDRPLVVQLSSKDVIHSFGIPAMRVKLDAIPGVAAPLSFTPTVTGVFDIACSQLCGLAHFRMRARLTIESEADFRRFLTDQSAALR